MDIILPSVKIITILVLQFVNLYLIKSMLQKQCTTKFTAIYFLKVIVFFTLVLKAILLMVLE